MKLTFDESLVRPAPSPFRTPETTEDRRENIIRLLDEEAKAFADGGMKQPSPRGWIKPDKDDPDTILISVFFSTKRLNWSKNGGMYPASREDFQAVIDMLMAEMRNGRIDEEIETASKARKDAARKRFEKAAAA